MTLPLTTHPQADKDIADLDHDAAVAVFEELDRLTEEGTDHPNVDFWTDNTGRRLFRLTVREERGGTVDHRIFFDIENGAAKIYGVFHRDEAYEPDVEEELTRRLR